MPSGSAFGTQQFDAKGWQVEVRRGPISRDAEIDALKDSLGAANIPEQLFGDNFLRLTHKASGTAIDFNAADALRTWHADNLAPVQVRIASQWQRSRKDAMDKVAALNYDWTYTTPYAGSLRTSEPADAAQQSLQPQTSAPEQQRQPRWQASCDQLDMALLTARDPILFYAEVPIYESELDDNGTSQLSVKARVMPTCWYVLMRFFLRVDSTLVRLREARLFCDLRSPDKVIREVKHMEATLAELSGNTTGPVRGVAHADADSAALALSAIAPDGVKLYRTETLLL